MTLSLQICKINSYSITYTKLELYRLYIKGTYHRANFFEYRLKKIFLPHLESVLLNLASSYWS